VVFQTPVRAVEDEIDAWIQLVVAHAREGRHAGGPAGRVRSAKIVDARGQRTLHRGGHEGGAGEGQDDAGCRRAGLTTLERELDAGTIECGIERGGAEDRVVDRWRLPG